MKYKYKKLLYLLGLTSMLTLNGCNRDNVHNVNNETTETNEEPTEQADKKICNHLDENSLNVKTLSDDSKYVSAANFFYSARENFLNNNRIIEMKGIDDTYSNFLNESEYLSLFSNPVIQDTLNSSECKGYIRYSENHDDNIAYLNIDAPQYKLSISSYLADSEMIKEIFIKDNVTFKKYLHSITYDNKYSINESYTLSSNATAELNKIDVIVESDYRFDFNKSSNCSDFNGSICLNSSMNELEEEVNEEEFYELTSLLGSYAKEDKSVEQFLEENDELMKEMFGLKYEMFIEDTKATSYTLKKSAN